MRSEQPLLRLTPRVRGRHWQYYVFTPLIWIVVGPFILAYKLFVGWWLNPLLDKRFENKLQEQVKTDLAFLFQDFDGRFVANERAHKNVIRVTVDAADLRIEISQHHGDYGIRLRRQDDPEIAENLISILEFIREKENLTYKPLYLNLAEMGSLFREKFSQVQTSLTAEHYPHMIATIDKRHHAGMQKAAQDFNRRPDGYFIADVVNPADLVKKAPK